MGQLESLMELDIAQSSHKKKKKKEKKKKKKSFMPWLVLLMRIPLSFMIILERY
jgi:hypothetical protein